MHLAAIALGDEEAFAAWLAGAEAPLRRSLRSFAGSADTEAVVQETLLRVWQVAGRCLPDGKPNSLLRLAVAIARNLALSEARRRAREAPLAGPPDAPDREVADPVVVPSDPFLRERIRACLESLPARPATAIRARLADGGGRSDRALAAHVGMRLNTFLQNVTRARRLLAGCLRRYGIEVA